MRVSTAFMSEPSLTPTRYDAVPYIGGTFQESHPEHLAALARLFGMAAPDPATARILEIGCAHGSNLLGIAQAYPQATILGIDASEVQIQTGKKTIAELGYKNLELRFQSVTDLDEGPWDYVICHGVYSWVPPEVQQAIMDVIAKHLSPTGVAYISYNVLPGWHGRMHVRDLMLFHAALFESSEDQIGQARAILGMLTRAVGEKEGGGAYGEATRMLQKSLGNQYDSYLFHEYLSPYNEPIYFQEFARRVDAVDMQYMGDGEFSSMLVSNFPPAIAEEVSVVAQDLIRTEQYMDYLRNRGFRKSLICHKEAELDRSLTWEDLKNLRVRALFKPDPKAELWELNDESLGAWIRNEVPLKVGTPLLKAMLHTLEQNRPGSMGLDELVAASQALIDLDPSEHDTEECATNLLACFAKDLIEVRIHPVPWATKISEKPEAWIHARGQADDGLVVTSLMHTSVRLDEFDRVLLPLLDGTRDLHALALAASETMSPEQFSIQWTGPDLAGSPMLIELLKPGIQEQLERILRLGLLVG
ncbi:MAG: methyltransferase-like protein [Cognaticolwellia sp.]|jgi:methyltransferase-like protein